ncbi:MAG TPA: ATP-binding protein [Rariglobus sp.]|jgi:signal transduction histidine kinase|nr:ATP-binding protein [Rariglobus sp.]
MNRILVISAQTRAAESLKVLMPADRFGIVHLSRPELIRESLPPSCIDLCVIDTDLADAGALRLVDEVRRQLPGIPLVVAAATSLREWEEDAILHGISFVFKKPLRGPLLITVFDRLLAGASAPVVAPPSESPVRTLAELRPGPVNNLSHLEILRDFSRLFSHSLNVRSLLHEFVLKLREVISVNRIALFLQPPQNPFLPGPLAASRRLPCVCSAGIAADLYRFFELSLDGGIGAAIAADGRILRADAGATLSLDARREFEILGGHIAIPILDRERLLGIAVLGGRLTGLQLSDQELQLLFHLLEELGLAIKNSWLHDQLTTNHRLLTNILGQMGAGCLVVARDLTILQANPALVRLLDLIPGAGRGMEFADLPQRLASLLYEVLNGGRESACTHYLHGTRTLLVTVTSFHLDAHAETSAVLVTIEDHTAIEAARRIEVDREHDRLISLIAEKFSHEIRNALLPLDTHRQLLPTDYARADFRTSLESALGRETSRILRCVDQLAFLSRAKNEPVEVHVLHDLLRQAAVHASTHSPAPVGLKLSGSSSDTLRVLCEPRSLRHALGEIILNAAQSSPDCSEISVRIDQTASTDGARRIRIGIVNPSVGFTTEALSRVFEPFYTTKSVGLGLGLAVTRKILRDHGGDAEVFARPHGEIGDIVVTLPLQ